LGVRPRCDFNATSRHQIEHPSYVRESSHVNIGVVKMQNRVFWLLSPFIYSSVTRSRFGFGRFSRRGFLSIRSSLWRFKGLIYFLGILVIKPCRIPYRIVNRIGWGSWLRRGINRLLLVTLWRDGCVVYYFNVLLILDACNDNFDWNLEVASFGHQILFRLFNDFKFTRKT
jgi:hypothetical protein